MKKRRFFVVTVIFTLFMQLISIMQPISVLALAGKDVSNTFKFITDISITDKNGNALGSDVSKDSEIRVNYNWVIPNKVDGEDFDVNSGDYYNLQLPEEIKIAANINTDINDSSGNKVATMQINTSGLVTIIFTDYPSTHSNVIGNFYAGCRFDSTKIGTNNPIPIEFTIPGVADKTIVNVDFDQPDPSIQKDVDGGYSAATDEITWKITVNKENVNVNSASVEDNIQNGQNFVPGSVNINGVADSSNNYSYDSSSRKFVYNFGDITTQKVITFKTSVHDDLAIKGQGTYNYSNNATLKYTESGSPKSKTTNNKTVSVPVKLISKNGSYDSINKRINWTITVNESGRTINNAVVSDTIPTGLTLDTSTIKIDGNQGSDYTNSGQNFSYNLGNITGQKIITFSTKVGVEVYNSNNSPNYTNTAILTGDGVAPGTSASIGVGVPTNIIKKEGVAYDASTGIITWKITVNNNKTDVAAGAVITDTISAGQTYVADSVSIDDDTNGSFTTLSEGQVVYTFNNSFNKTYTIILKTQVTDPKNYRANYGGNYSNKANILATNIDQESTGTQYISSNVISKTGTGYNYLTREITWQIVVNTNKMPITNAVITDVIPAGQQYVNGTATIDDGTMGSFDSDSNISSTGILKYTFNDTINKTYKITFKTKLTDLSIFYTNGDKTVYNTAVITGDEIPTTGKRDSQGSQTIKNYVVSKSSAYTYGNSYIDWTVKTNSNWNLDLSNSTITDSLPDGLELDTDTVELYKATVNASNGSLIQSNSVALTADNVKYDLATRKFDFTFPADAGTSAFILKFRTNTTKGGNFSNTVLFKGSGIEQTSTDTENGVWFSSGGGSATGETAGIKIIKYNDDGSKKLSGAVFQLIDQYGNVKATSSATGSDGSVLFNKLKYDRNYSIKEITSPTGYKPNSNVYTFQIKSGLGQGTLYDSSDGLFKFYSSDNTNKIVTYNYQNNILKGNIEFYKSGIEGILQGAEFTLYTEDGSTAVKNSSGNNITATSGSDGRVLFSNVPYGKYKIKETSAPISYSIYKGDITADLTTITYDGQTVSATPFMVVNSKIKGSVKITKTDEETGDQIQGSAIAIFDNNKEQVGNAKITGIDGTVQFDNLVYGDYYYKEISSPDNYVLDSTYHSFKIETDGTSSSPQLLSFTNKKVIRGNIEFTKIGEDTDSQALQGAVFTLYREDGVTPFTDVFGPITATSDINGTVRFNSVEYGNYKIRETSAPRGYNVSEQVLSASIQVQGDTVITKDSNGNDISSFSNSKVKSSIKIIKYGADGVTPLADAEFTLYDDETGTVLGVKKTDGTGIIRFDNLEYGKYRVQETKAPTGYVLSKMIIKKEISSINDNAKVYEYNISNVKITGSVSLQKIDENGNPIKGTEFKIYDKTDTLYANPLCVVVSDYNGLVKFLNVVYGEYTIVETKTSDDSYVLLTSSLSTTIGDSDDGKNIHLGPIVNIKKKGTVKLKKTDVNGNSLKGAEFTLYDNNHNMMTTATSNDDGMVIFTNVIYGNYSVEETKAPTGYNINHEVKSVKVTEDGGVYDLGVIVDVQITGGIEISKTDLATSAPVPGATLTIYTKDHEKVVEGVTGQDGIIQFDQLNYGDYYFVETNAPEGYLLNPDKHPFSIKENGVVLKDNITDISNSQIILDAEPSSIVGDGKSTTVITAKVVDGNNKPLANVKVDFSAEKGDFPQGSSAVTDKNGEASVVYRSGKIEGLEEQVIPVTVYVHDEKHGLNAKDQIKITFMPGSIKGVVTDNDTGLPVKGAIVEIKQDFDGDGVIDFTAKVVTSDDGKYKIVVPKGDVAYDIFITKAVKINGKMENKTFVQQAETGTMTGTGEDVFDSVKTVAGIILIKNADGNEAYLSDYSKYSIEMPGSNGDIKIGNEGNSKGIFEITNLEKGQEYILDIVYHFEDGTKIIVGTIELTLDSNGEMIICTALIDPYGIITDATTGKVIEGADVKLYYADTKRNADSGKKAGTLVELPGLENFPPANNKNPQYSDKNGNYAFMVFPNTDYYVVATKLGYNTFTSGTIEVNDAIVRLDIQMTPEQKSSEIINTIDASKLPKTGSLIGSTSLMVIGFMTIVLGVVLIFMKRRRVNK